MNKRTLLAGLTALLFSSTVSNAASESNRNTATWRVPAGIKRIRVRSWKPDGSKDIDRMLDVEPGTMFRIDAIEE